VDEDKLIASVGPSEAEAPALAMETDTARLMQIALSSGSVEQLEKLIELKNREEERAAKKIFDRNFAKMQQEFKPVARTKKGDKAKYAPLDHLQKQFGPIIAAHKFSYRWSEEPLPEGGLRVILSISGYGYTQENYKDLPAYVPDTGGASGKAIMNSLQAEGTRSTYGQRYTFIAGFGLIIEDMDDDGASFADGVKYGDMIRAIEAETHPDDLYALVKKYRQELKSAGDPRGVELITTAYTKRKGEVLG